MAKLMVVANSKRNMRTLLSLALAGIVTTACASSHVASDNTAQKSAAEPASRVILYQFPYH